VALINHLPLKQKVIKPQKANLDQTIIYHGL